MTATCSTCRHWRPVDSAGWDITNTPYGRCTINSPEIDYGNEDYYKGVWPITRDDDGCSEHDVTAPGMTVMLNLTPEIWDTLNTDTRRFFMAAGYQPPEVIG